MSPAERDGATTVESIASQLGLTASAVQINSLESYLELLTHWNATYNLTAVRDRDAMRVHHLADCLALIPALSRQAVHGRVLDVGSGGGLPGIVIATMRPDLEVVCVDSVAKKIAFIRQAAGMLSLPNLSAVHSRVEDLSGREFDLVTARAFSSLALMARLTLGKVAPSGRWVAMKGQLPADEIAELAASELPVEVFHVEPLTVPGLDAARCLIWLRAAEVAAPI